MYIYQIPGSTITATLTASKAYTYGDSECGDLLTQYGSAAISYDTIGNPTSWVNGQTITWDGRLLKKLDYSNKDVYFTYNADGIRTSKTYDSASDYTINYVLDGTKIIAEIYTSGSFYDVQYYYYDESGSPIGIRYGGDDYYYVKNNQGDITNIVDTNGNVVVTYTYDAWGKLLSTTGSRSSDLGKDNPFRYRGYYYDYETGLYYVSSRYYDPETCRFINADSQLNPQEGFTGYNMFQYCGNNPVNRSDPTGHAFMFLTAAIGAVAGAIVGGVVAAATGKDVLAGALVGAADGKPITYDDAGNTLTYDGYTFTWEAGRQLAAISGNGQTISYKYNDSGYRTEKTANGVTTKYYLDGDKVILEENGSDSIYYSYDADDKLVSMTLNGTEYFYIRNSQGDITGLIDTEGTQVVSYTYDSWGKLVSIDGSLKDTVGLKNPYRYRGYRYDTETGLFYVGSRYYDPEIGRFINADEPEILMLAAQSDYVLGANLFAYCMNNPVNYSDPTGMWLANLICGAVGAAALGTLAYVTCRILGLDGKTTAIVTASFAVLGGIIGAVLGPKFLLTHAPKLLKAIQAIEKTKFSLKAIPPNGHGNIFGINISNILMIMLHYPHPNELFFHIQVDVKLPGVRQKTIWKKPLIYVKSMTWWK